MNADEIWELVLRLPPGGALVLPAEVGRQTIEIAIGKATVKDPTLVLTINEQLTPRLRRGRHDLIRALRAPCPRVDVN